MSRKIFVPVFTAILGLLVGAGAVEFADHRIDQQSKERFAQKARCKSLADQYIRGNTDIYKGLGLEKADFSEAHNTCFAAINSYATYGNESQQSWELVDLLSGEVTTIGSCSVRRDCGGGRDIRFSNRLNAVFKSAIDGTEPPKDTPNR
ncbi:MAG TPA: hypothetical protein VGG45_19485 [Terracidiphilus sp.]|jgi:hypothetical protein